MPMTDEELQKRIDARLKTMDEGTRIGITYQERVQELEGQVVQLTGWMREIRTDAHNEVTNTRSTRASLINALVEIEDTANFALEGKKKS